MLFKHPHQPHTVHGHHHWITAGIVLAALLLTLTEVHGQTTMGAGAMFQGRPEMAGAQGGLGAQAGPPTGGIGIEGSTGARRGLDLRKPSGLDTMGKPTGDPLTANSPDPDASMLIAKDDSIVRKTDNSVAREQASPVKKTKRAAKRTAQSARHGLPAIDAQAKATATN